MSFYFVFKRRDTWNGKENWVPGKLPFLAMMQLIFAVMHVETDLFLEGCLAVHLPHEIV